MIINVDWWLCKKSSMNFEVELIELTFFLLTIFFALFEFSFLAATIWLVTKCHRPTWICLAMTRKVSWNWSSKIEFWPWINSLDQNARSELMNYQPSPYNNNLDLNELLNVGDSDPIKNSEFNVFSSQFSSINFCFVPD